MITLEAAAAAARAWDRRGEYGKADAVLLLIRGSLAQRESEVYGYIREHPWSSSVAASQALGITRTNASLTCYRLEKYGLIKRLPKDALHRKLRWSAEGPLLS